MDPLKFKVLGGLILFLICLGLLIFLSAWSLLYWQGWVYLLIISISLISMTLYFLNHDRALMERRVNIGPGAETRRSQQLILSIFILLLIGLVVLSGIDHRLHGAYLPPVCIIFSSVMILFGVYILYRVFKENSFASATVEVVNEQKVISTGPYSIVRHPMYSGVSIIFLFTPIVLDSLLGMIPVALMVAIQIFRIRDEEKYLIKNLPGYPEYCKRTKFRLIPYLW